MAPRKAAYEAVVVKAECRVASNAYTSLAEAILFVLQKGTAPEKINEARAYAERFTPQRMMCDYLELADAP